jgi:hypothetical protein
MRTGRTRGLAGITVVVALGLIGAILPAQASDAVVPLVTPLPAGTGIDVSHPQCTGTDKTSHLPYPSGTSFVVVGVNNGTAGSKNPCFETEYNDALLLNPTTPTEQPTAAVYLNTADPALAGAWWPNANQTQGGGTLPTINVNNPMGICAHKAGAACAYVYGYSMAQYGYAAVKGQIPNLPSRWWLDVETSNTWQTDVSANAASLIGMVDYLHSQDITDVGIYSTPYQWKTIAGVTAATSTLAGLPSWLAGYSSTGAAVGCAAAPLTPGGRVSMVQYVDTFDTDYSCHVFAPSAAISPATSLALVGTKLTAVAGAWSDGGATYAYQWRRNGAAIPSATASVYSATAADAGKKLTVTVTARELGYNTASQTSSSVTIASQLVRTPRPATAPNRVVRIPVPLTRSADVP